MKGIGFITDQIIKKISAVIDIKLIKHAPKKFMHL